MYARNLDLRGAGYQPVSKIGLHPRAAGRAKRVQKPPALELDAGELQRENEALMARVKALETRLKKQKGQAAPPPRRSALSAPPPYTDAELQMRWILRRSTPGQPMPFYFRLVFTWPGKAITAGVFLSAAALMASSGSTFFLPLMIGVLVLCC